MDGVRVGLHYPGVETVLRLTVADDQRRAVFDGIQLMERAALQAFARQAEDRARRAKTR